MIRDLAWRRWKHAATCHQGSTIDGEADVFAEDEVFRAVKTAAQADEDDDEASADSQDEESVENEDPNRGTDRGPSGAQTNDEWRMQVD